MTDFNRRSVLAAGALLAVSAAAASAQAQEPAQIAYEPQPLPFDPTAIPGLSERLLRSHHERNYTGAVRRLGAIQTELAALDIASAPGFTVNGLKREELIALNSMILHEVYFAGLNAQKEPGDALGMQIERDFGSLDR